MLGETNLGPAHGAGGVPVEPGGDAVLAEDVLAVEDRRVLEAVVTNGTRAAAGFHLLHARATTVSLETK